METVKGPCRSAEEEITYLVETHQLALLRLCFAYLHDIRHWRRMLFRRLF